MLDMPILVTKPFLPPIEDYQRFIEDLWQSKMLSNNGKYVQQLEDILKTYLNVPELLYCTNGTVALQLAIKALGLTKEIITTPFSYVATINSIIWENCTPIFADINADDLCIDAKKIEAKITKNTEAILATHVFGHACDIEAIEAIATKYQLKVIYDAAHCFGSKYKEKSLFSFGDITTGSFHATKLFHTTEGGCVVTNNKELSNIVAAKRDHGFINKHSETFGINARQSEFHAAMGICNFKYIDAILNKRKSDAALYLSLLKNTTLSYPVIKKQEEYNHAYFPVIFPNESSLLKSMQLLEDNKIYCRRYFYPSLNTLPYLTKSSCEIAEDVSRRVVCLPMYHDLSEQEINHICNLICQSI